MPVSPELIRQIESATVAAEKGRKPKADPVPDDQEKDPSAALHRRLHSEVNEAHREAADEWGQAEAALTKALRAKRGGQVEEVPNDLSQLPLRQASLQGGGGGSQSAVSLRPGGELFSSLSEGELQARTQLTQPAYAAQEAAFAQRAQRMRSRAGDAAKNLKDHAKRRLRVKIGGILKEVKRRNTLRQQQEKARKFREQQQKIGRGPRDLELGDADEYALGLGPERSEDFGETISTPRRRYILDALSLDELNMVRQNPRWFIESSAEPGVLPSERREEVADEGLESLIDFFTPARKDKDMPIDVWVQQLKARLSEASAMDAQDKADAFQMGSWGSSTSGGSTRGAFLTQTSTDSFKEGFHASLMTATSTASMYPARRMPIRKDEASPTLQKVREVFNRKEAQDAELLEERQMAMEERTVRNAFKAQEQKREFELTHFKQKELHKVRMLEAAERKQTLEFEAEERLGNQEIAKLRRLRQALDQAEDETERKRDKATEHLQAWRDGVDRAEKYRKKKDRQALIEHRQNEEAYIAKLLKVGEMRANVSETQAQKNDKLKQRIQVSLVDQLEEKRRYDSDMVSVALDEKLEAARHRRQQGLSKYNFLEKAFNGEKIGFDPKYAFTPSRTGDSWEKKKALLVDFGTTSSPALKASSP
mmetsp:Transcript_32391/g.58877  ORF Transcript_32391/g.58877 Transcript_32391/m.58877 type:complete len:652 (-) Transcript_32391:167-2122(-)